MPDGHQGTAPVAQEQVNVESADNAIAEHVSNVSGLHIELENEIYSTPKKFTRSVKQGQGAHLVDGSKVFPKWFKKKHAAHETQNGMDSKKGMEYSWADSTDEDGLGEISFQVK